MKIWKVILATLVIFSAGVLAGGLVVKSFQPPPQMVRQTNAVPERWMQKVLLERMKADLNLTSEQKQRVERIFAESQERMSVLWDIINPEIQTELREVREKIRAELRPDGKPELVVTRMAGIGGLDSLLQIEPRLFTRAPGTAAVAAGGTEPSKRLLREALPMMVSAIDVQKKIAAAPCVKCVKKFAPPELPNTVWLEPLKEALISAPFPDWIRTTSTSRTQVTI